MAELDHVAIRNAEKKIHARDERALDLTLAHYCRAERVFEACGRDHAVVRGVLSMLGELLAQPDVAQRARELGSARLSAVNLPAPERPQNLLVALARAPGSDLETKFEQDGFQRVSAAGAQPILYCGTARKKALAPLVSALGGTLNRYDPPTTVTASTPAAAQPAAPGSDVEGGPDHEMSKDVLPRPAASDAAPKLDAERRPSGPFLVSEVAHDDGKDRDDPGRSAARDRGLPLVRTEGPRRPMGAELGEHRTSPARPEGLAKIGDFSAAASLIAAPEAWKAHSGTGGGTPAESDGVDRSRRRAAGEGEGQVAR